MIIQDDYGLDAVDDQITAIQQQLIPLQAIAATVASLTNQIAALQTALNTINYYTRAEANAAFSPTAHLHPLTHLIDLQAEARLALQQTTLAMVRSGFGLGSAATQDAAAFEPIGALANHNIAADAHDIPERARDAVGAAIECQNGTLYASDGSSEYVAGGSWKLKSTAGAILDQGAAGSTAPPIGLSKMIDDTGNRIVIRNVVYFAGTPDPDPGVNI